MKNKVTVTRAHRLNLVKYKDYAVLSNVSKYLIEADGTVAVVNNEGNAIYIEARRMHSHLWGTYDMVYPMDNFEDVAKWVANGRKLEDLQSDTKSEWVSFSTIPIGTIFSYGASAIVAMKSDYKRAVNMDGNIGNVLMNMDKAELVWPIGAGDTITIEITE